MKALRSTHNRQESAARAQRSLLACVAHLPISALVTAGILMVGSPAWGVTLDARPSGEARFGLNLKAALERVDGAKSPGGDVAALVRLELDSLLLLDRQVARKALDPRSLSSETREHGFSLHRAGIRWRFSLVESAGEHCQVEAVTGRLLG